MDRQALKLLEEIKWLLALQLQQNGVPSKDIAKAIGVDPAVISRKLPRQRG